MVGKFGKLLHEIELLAYVEITSLKNKQGDVMASLFVFICICLLTMHSISISRKEAIYIVVQAFISMEIKDCFFYMIFDILLA